MQDLILKRSGYLSAVELDVDGYFQDGSTIIASDSEHKFGQKAKALWGLIFLTQYPAPHLTIGNRTDADNETVETVWNYLSEPDFDLDTEPYPN